MSDTRRHSHAFSESDSRVCTNCWKANDHTFLSCPLPHAPLWYCEKRRVEGGVPMNDFWAGMLKRHGVTPLELNLTNTNGDGKKEACLVEAEIPRLDQSVKWSAVAAMPKTTEFTGPSFTLENLGGMDGNVDEETVANVVEGTDMVDNGGGNIAKGMTSWMNGSNNNVNSLHRQTEVAREIAVQLNGDAHLKDLLSEMKASLKVLVETANATREAVLRVRSLNAKMDDIQQRLDLLTEEQRLKEQRKALARGELHFDSGFTKWDSLLYLVVICVMGCWAALFAFWGYNDLT